MSVSATHRLTTCESTTSVTDNAPVRIASQVSLLTHCAVDTHGSHSLCADSILVISNDTIERVSGCASLMLSKNRASSGLHWTPATGAGYQDTIPLHNEDCLLNYVLVDYTRLRVCRDRNYLAQFSIDRSRRQRGFPGIVQHDGRTFGRWT